MRVKNILVIKSKYSRPVAAQMGLETLGFSVHEAATEQSFLEGLKNTPVLVLVEIAGDDESWAPWLTHLRSAQPRIIPVLGFTDHYSVTARQRAQALGCDTLITRQAILYNVRWQVGLYARPEDGKSFAALPEGVREGIRLFNEGKFHECHDEIEPVWLAEISDVRLFYAAILQIGIAYYQVEKKKFDVAARMFTCGLLKLRHFLPAFMGVDTEDLYVQAQQDQGRISSLSNFPKIKWIEPQ